MLYPTVDDSYLTWEELENQIGELHKDKDGKTVVLYSSNKEEQYTYIEKAKEKGYTVLLLDSPIVPHLIQKIEQQKEGISFSRVDSDSIEKLIQKEENQVSKLSDEQQETLKSTLEEQLKEQGFIIQLEALNSNSDAFMLTEPEFMRRMKDMQQTGGGGMMGMGSMPDMYNLVVNTNSEIAQHILDTENTEQKLSLINQALDLAKLSKGLLKGEALATFVSRSYKLIK